jgi:hypothetical protein
MGCGLTPDTVAGESKAFGANAVCWTISGEMIERLVRLLELEWELPVRSWCIVRKDDRRLALASDVFH